MRPLLLRPPVEFLPSVSALTGLPLCRVARSTRTSCRWLGVVGLNVFSAMTLSSQTRRHVDAVTLFEGHDRALEILLPPDAVAIGLQLAAAVERVDGLYRDPEQLPHRPPDLRPGPVAPDPDTGPA